MIFPKKTTVFQRLPGIFHVFHRLGPRGARPRAAAAPESHADGGGAAAAEGGHGAAERRRRQLRMVMYQ